MPCLLPGITAIGSAGATAVVLKNRRKKTPNKKKLNKRFTPKSRTLHSKKKGPRGGIYVEKNGKKYYQRRNNKN